MWAGERSQASSLPLPLAVGDASTLDFSDNTFDACRSETVLMHLDGEPARAIAEIVRVTRAGGRVVVSALAKPSDRMSTELFSLATQRAISITE